MGCQVSAGQIIRDSSGRPLLHAYGWPDGATAPSGPQLMPFTRDHLPALERMQRAEQAITAWQRAGKRPWVMWEPWVEIQDSEGQVLPHPMGCLPEVIHLICRKYPPDTAGLNRNPPYASGGAA